MSNAQTFIRALALANGTKVENVKLIGGYANKMFKLEPHAIVARMTGSAIKVREGEAWLKREIKLANHLSRKKASVVQPYNGFPTGPHRLGKHYLTFWEYLEIAPRTITPTEVGSALCELHKALEDYPGELPVMGPLEETWAILARPEVSDRLFAADRQIISRTSDRIRDALSRRDVSCRPLHGDAHYGNLWPTDRGLVWGDFEDSSLGPVEWDLACMTASSTVFGNGVAGAAALEAYSGSYEADLLELLIIARTLQGIAWAAISLAEPSENSRLRTRLDWLANS